MLHDNHDARIDGGESFHDIRARFVPFVAGLKGMYRHTDANLLLISHGGTLRCMLPLLVSNIDNASVLHRPFGYATPIVVELRDDEWVCLRWGEEVLQG
jgi:broad specificity phosphatase PhoE